MGTTLGGSVGPGQEMQASTGGQSAALRVAAISGGKDRRDGRAWRNVLSRAGRTGLLEL